MAKAPGCFKIIIGIDIRKGNHPGIVFPDFFLSDVSDFNFSQETDDPSFLFSQRPLYMRNTAPGLQCEQRFEVVPDAGYYDIIAGVVFSQQLFHEIKKPGTEKGHVRSRDEAAFSMTV